MEFIVEMKEDNAEEASVVSVGTNTIADAIEIALERVSSPENIKWIKAYTVLAGKGKSRLVEGDNT